MKSKLLAFVYVLALAFIVYLADASASPSPFAFVYVVPFGDKCGHFVLSGLFALALDAAFPWRTFKLGRVALPLGGGVAFAVITLEECSQIFFRARTFDPLDLLADGLGVACAALAAARPRSRAAGANPFGISG